LSPVCHQIQPKLKKLGKQKSVLALSMFSDAQPEDQLHPVSSDEFLPAISLWTTLGGLFLVGTFGCAFTLATFIKYNVTVRATATVRPTGELRIVQAANSGTIKSILIKENQVVKKGDVIATIDDSHLQTQKKQLIGNIQQNQLQLTQINAQISELDSQMAAQSQLMERTIAGDQAELRRNQRDYKDRQVTAGAEVQEAQATVELAREELKRYQQLAKTGAIPSLQIKEKEEAFKVAQARLQRAKTGLNPSADNVAIAQEKIAQEQARGKSTLATLNKERKQIIQHQIEIQNQINRDRQEFQQLQTELKKSVIHAPESGTILQLHLRNTGQVVNPPDAIAQIAPSNAPLLVKAHVSAADISKVKVCKQEKVSDCFEGKVQLRVSAYPYPDYGTLKGAVRVISADAITPESSSVGAAAPYYEVTIQPERAYLIKSARSYPIKPGMEVTADIISRQETLLMFILRKVRLLTDF
jgi:HlyD family type I secretion membrane fusion protein